jgi:hypothetical protein
VAKQQELDERFNQVLAALRTEGLITREQVMQDGTKVKAQASVRSDQQEQTMREHLQRARRRVAERGDPWNEESNPRTKQARAGPARAARAAGKRLARTGEAARSQGRRKG